MKNITYIVSDIDKALAFEWVVKYLNKQSLTLNFILLNKNDSHLEQFLRNNNIPVKRVYLFTGWKMMFSFFSVLSFLVRTRPDIIHTHLRYGSLLGIAAGYIAGIKKRIHTRHHASSNHEYYPHAVKHDKFISRLSTHTVSISDVVSDVLINWEKTPEEKINKIPHGFELTLFEKVDNERINHIREIYNIPNTTPTVGVISRFMNLKGIIYIIKAFKNILLTHPDAHLILANAKGPDADVINNKLSLLPPDSYTTITFENDIAALYQLFDVFIHVPISKHSEAFGQTYIEALASGVPSIFTLSGVACEFIKNEENALVVPYKDATSITKAIQKIISDPKLRTKLVKNGKESVKPYALKPFITRLDALYLNDFIETPE